MFSIIIIIKIIILYKKIKENVSIHIYTQTHKQNKIELDRERKYIIYNRILNKKSIMV